MKSEEIIIPGLIALLMSSFLLAFVGFVLWLFTWSINYLKLSGIGLGIFLILLLILIFLLAFVNGAD